MTLAQDAETKLKTCEGSDVNEPSIMGINAVLQVIQSCWPMRTKMGKQEIKILVANNYC